MQLTLIPEKNINEFFLSKHFVFQEFESVFVPEMSEDYHGFSITPEYPNGGMTAISVTHIATKRWWSIPTDCHKLNPDLPDFDYGDDDKAFAWVKTLIDEYLGIIPNPKIGSMPAIKVSVTAAHIANAAPYPSKSPIALALRELGYHEATVTHRFAYIDSKVYALPEVAIASEIKFDFLAKGGALQGELNENIFPYTFELEELKQDV